tara:strand:- start:6424 stop:7287 length:864 start_codon:yes stop_codon:yes gene_type:complete
MKIGVFGIGLIGGSLSIQARKHFTDSKIYGFDLSNKNLNRALKLGLIDAILDSNEIKNLNLILVAVPVNSVKSIVLDLFDQINKDSLIIDFSSTKKEICDAISDHPKRDQFLATHPIAGTEFSGPDSAFENLFHNKIQILCETNKTRKSLSEFATKWFLKIGMKIREINPTEHDLQVAYVSHLSHISSFMLGKTVIEKSKNETTILNLAGSGFESTVRLAKSSPDMWVPIFKQNRSNVIETLSQYIDNLNKFKNLVDECKYEEIYDQMKSINSIRKILDGLTNSGKT